MSTVFILVAGDARIAGLIETARAADATASVTAIVVGPRDTAQAVATQGVDAVTWLGDAPVSECLAPAVADAVAAAAPRIVLAATRPADRALAGAVAAKLAAPVYTGVESITSSGDIEITRGVFGGIATETVRTAGPVVVVADGGAGAGGHSPAPITEAPGTPLAGVDVVETRAATNAQVDLGRAGRIVSVGRGLKAPGDVAMIEALATALGAETACSRPMAEGVGWFTHDRYVGVTGQRVHPDLYVAIGISGQLQHTVGARDSGTIVAINSDPKAPYFAEADYCVVGDLYAVVPALTAALV